MLKLCNITKEYPTGDTKVLALKGVDVELRENEFVSILGHSGCGKTTLLNIIGGLDQYTDGDLIIDGKSTKDFTDRDWDTYRNHRVGFVFQNYNLIPHQSILANVELALTLSGVSKGERKQRAKEALIKVGLGDQIGKKPNQLSGGQMQRVAIARALVNNPEILLADEPTGALDSETSVQVMDLLKEIAKDKLVVMVTHNPELADLYSTRIIRLIDGKIVDDSDPYTSPEQEPAPVLSKKEVKKAKKKDAKSKKTSMSFATALALSMNNLLTKKMRTFLTSFAGSIGIIGIALILSLSNGFQLYIESIQREALTSYPIMIENSTMDMNSMASGFAIGSTPTVEHPLDKVYSNTMMADMLEAFTSGVHANDLAALKEFLEGNEEVEANVSSVQYAYGGKVNVFAADTENGANQVFPGPITDMMESMMGTMDMGGMISGSSMMSSYETMYESWQALNENTELLHSQYSVVKGRWPENYNEVILIVDKNNEISGLAVQGLGLASAQDMTEAFMAMQSGEEYTAKEYEIEYDDVLNTTFRLVLEPDYFQYNAETDTYDDMHGDEEYVKSLIANGEEIKVVGIVKPTEGTLMVQTMGSIGYTNALIDHVIEETNKCELVKKQREDKETDVFTGLPFPTEEKSEEVKPADKKAEEKKPEQEATTAKAKDVDLVTEKPVVATLGKKEEKPQATFTANTFDFSAFPDVTEEEVYASIEENNSGEDAVKAKRTVELMLKSSLSISERKELISYLDEMLAGQQIEGMGKISGQQAYGYLKLMDRKTKLKMLSGMMSGAFGDVNGEENPDETEPEEIAEPEPEPEPEPQPLAQSYEEAIELLGAADIHTPRSIYIFPKDFESKDNISAIIDKYNEGKSDDEKIIYTDYIGLLLSSVTKIVNIISYVLIAFVAISLVVSSIMIGIITYISVLERTKEIGILRAIGASKHDISTVFNAETLIVGFVSGVIGIGATLLLNIPINRVIQYLTQIPDVSQLPTAGGFILVGISMFLTLVAGLIPSRIASKKDPVVALRTE